MISPSDYVPKLVKRHFEFWKFVVVHFYEVNGTTRAAALAYTTLLSAVPLAVMGIGILSAFPVFDEYADKIQRFLFSHFLAASAGSIQSHLKTFASKAAGLSLTSIFFLLVAAVLLIFTMESAFNAIWKIRTRRHGVTAFLIYWAVLTLIPILAAGGLAMSIYVFSLPYFKDAAETVTKSIPVFEIFPTALVWLGFALLYTTLPNTKVLFRHASVGALVAAILFEAVKFGFGFYIRHFSSYEFVYGALAALPIFLIWIYFSWLIILFGAAVTFVKQTRAQ